MYFGKWWPWFCPAKDNKPDWQAIPGCAIIKLLEDILHSVLLCCLNIDKRFILWTLTESFGFKIMKHIKTCIDKYTSSRTACRIHPCWNAIRLMNMEIFTMWLSSTEWFCDLALVQKRPPIYTYTVHQAQTTGTILLKGLVWKWFYSQTNTTFATDIILYKPSLMWLQIYQVNITKVMLCKM